MTLMVNFVATLKSTSQTSVTTSGSTLNSTIEVYADDELNCAVIECYAGWNVNSSRLVGAFKIFLNDMGKGTHAEVTKNIVHIYFKQVLVIPLKTIMEIL